MFIAEGMRASARIAVSIAIGMIGSGTKRRGGMVGCSSPFASYVGMSNAL